MNALVPTRMASWQFSIEGIFRQLERNTKKSLLESRLERSRWHGGRPDLWWLFEK